MAKKKQELAKKKEESWCCLGGWDRGFPTFAVILLVLGALWILSDLKIIEADVPWFPVILVIIALGWIVDHYRKK